MIWLMHFTLVVVVAGLAHFASLLAFPFFTPSDAFSRLIALTQESTVTLIKARDIQTIPYTDPYTRIAACRYDLAAGPLRIRTPLSDTYLVIVLIEPKRGIFSSVSDKAGTQGSLEVVLATPHQLEQMEAMNTEDEAIDEIRIIAPNSKGIALIKVLADTPSVMPNVEAVLSQATCTNEILPVRG